MAVKALSVVLLALAAVVLAVAPIPHGFHTLCAASPFHLPHFIRGLA